MPKEAFGGDDRGGSGAAPEKKKPSLGKFGLSPDANIRDVFWKILASYAAAKKPGVDLAGYTEDRFVLMRAALSVLSRHDEQSGLSPRFIAMYSLMMLIDGGWKDALSEFLERSSERKAEAAIVMHAMKKLIAHNHYGEALCAQIIQMVRGRDTCRAGLEMLAGVGSDALAMSAKKELMILARGDVGENQHNAIKALALIKDDQDAKRTFIVLLSHWDAQTRLAAAEVLSGMGRDKEILEAVVKRAASETDEQVKKVLKRIL